jgi:hypothetical protein
MPLSEMENIAVGMICGVSDTTATQPTNYWKNAQQQKRPLTLDPCVIPAAPLPRLF